MATVRSGRERENTAIPVFPVYTLHPSYVLLMPYEGAYIPPLCEAPAVPVGHPRILGLATGSRQRPLESSRWAGKRLRSRRTR